ncbi:IS1380 family transposase, partial [Holdemanella porci]|uniref:IS1380 family transposase n=1 Tax=Holdemanella porci TaxID=2652276 RepID=UPI00314544C5
MQTNSLFDKINFNGGNLSSDGGSILLSQFLEKINLKTLLDSISFVDLRHLPVYSNTNILFQQIIKCLLGYNDQSDQKILINDPLLSLKSLICSQATVSRFYDRVSLNTTNEFKKIITQLAYDFVNTNIDDPILDADSTMVTTCGNQEASAYIHHYQKNGYHPLVINEYHSKLLLSSLLRTGSAYSSNGIIEELEQIFTQLNNTGNIRFRGDSAFYRRDLFKYLENNQVTYYIRVKNFKKNIRESVMDMVINQVDWNDFDYTEPYYGEYTIQINKTKKRRIVYKAFRLEKGGMLQLVPMVYCIITNDFEKSPKEAMDFYEARGNSENFTKELKDDFNGG